MAQKAFIMRLMGMPTGETTPFDFQYLKDFDFEAHDGVGEVEMTMFAQEAKHFGSMREVNKFYLTSPKCKPLREDGLPNRPLTATNWEIIPVMYAEEPTAPEDATEPEEKKAPPE